MAVTLQSSNNTAFTTGDLVLTKPTGLVVGDLMVVIITTQNTGGITTPSGWSNFLNVASTGATIQIRCYSKTADSSDVAASSFTFVDTAGYNKTGGIFRIDGQHSATPVGVTNSDGTITATSTPTFNSTVTPNNASSLLLFCLAGYAASGSFRTASGYAVATSNPTWTEQFDNGVGSGGNNWQGSVATATRTQVTATGNASATFTGGNCAEIVNIMIVVRPQITFTTTETESVVDSTRKQLNKRITETESVVDTLISEKDRAWANTTKNSSSWVNQDKS